MKSFTFKNQTYYFEHISDQTRILLPSGTNLFISHFSFPFRSIDETTLPKYLESPNNSVLPTKKDYPRSVKNEYTKIWGHKYDAGVHWVNCSPIPPLYLEKINKYDLKVSAIDSKLWYDQGVKALTERGLNPLHTETISLYLRYDKDLIIKYSADQIKVTLTEAQLTSADEAVVVSSYSRGEVKDGYFFILDVILCKQSKDKV